MIRLLTSFFFFVGLLVSNAQTPLCFSEPNTNLLGFTFYGICVGDFNSDSNADVVATGSNPWYSTILGNGDGTFNTSNTSSSNIQNVIATGDFNNDGVLDIVISMLNSSFRVYMGVGNGTFSPGTTLNLYSTFRDFVVDDFNNDAKLDIIILEYGPFDLIECFPGNGNGTFGTPLNFSVDGTSFVTGNFFNNDSIMDAVVCNRNSNEIKFLTGNGNGSFTIDSIYSTGQFPFAVEAGDLNNDGRMDFVVTNYNDSSLSVFMNSVTGTYNLTNYPSQAKPSDLKIADLDNDGNLDVVNYSGTDSTILVYFGDGTGNLLNPQYFLAYSPGWQLMVNDFNNDSKPDIVLCHGTNGGISFLFNTTCSTMLPQVNSVDELKIYPNPAENFLKVSNIKMDANLQIIDSRGIIVFEINPKKQSIEINTENLCEGIYILQVKTLTSLESIKLIIYP